VAETPVITPLRITLQTDNHPDVRCILEPLKIRLSESCSVCNKEEEKIFELHTKVENFGIKERFSTCDNESEYSEVSS
jgi:hypothetical protein